MKRKLGELGQRIDWQSLLQTFVVIAAVVGVIAAQAVNSGERLAKVEEQHAQMIRLLEKQDRVIEETKKQTDKLTALMEELIRQRKTKE